MSEFPDALMKLSRTLRNPEEALRELPDDQFRVALLASAELLRQMRNEAVRRGIWDELKGIKP